MWQSPTYLFVIDGGHKLSVLKAWVQDDSDDGPISQKFFGYDVSSDQKKAADKARELINSKIGSWQHFQAKIDDSSELTTAERKRVNTIISRGLPIQWVKGDPDKAAESFFKINMKGTPLDDVEELLLRNRKKPISIKAESPVLNPVWRPPLSILAQTVTAFSPSRKFPRNISPSSLKI